MSNYDDVKTTEPDPNAWDSRCPDCGRSVEHCRCTTSEDSHYVPWFCETTPSNKQIAVCGAATGPYDHSNEPTCPQCSSWLMSTEPLR